MSQSVISPASEISRPTTSFLWPSLCDGSFCMPPGMLTMRRAISDGNCGGFRLSAMSASCSLITLRRRRIHSAITPFGALII